MIINFDPDARLPIGYEILRKEVRKAKQVTALDNYLFLIYVQAKSDSKIKERCIIKTAEITNFTQKNVIIIRNEIKNKMETNAYLEIKNDLWIFDGTYSFDGSKKFDAYQTREEL